MTESVRVSPQTVFAAYQKAVDVQDALSERFPELDIVKAMAADMAKLRSIYYVAMVAQDPMPLTWGQAMDVGGVMSGDFKRHWERQAWDAPKKEAGE